MGGGGGVRTRRIDKKGMRLLYNAFNTFNFGKRKTQQTDIHAVAKKISLSFSVIERPLMTRRVVGSIPHGRPTAQRLV